jgi:SAM-dependent methyltransferase
MSYRLACRGHRPIAVDLRTDERDGLGAARHYGARGFVFPRFEAEFDRLPFGDGQFDLAVFNAAFHYATDAEEVLREAVRCLKGSGRVVIMDTPIYRRTADGERMRAERRREFLERYGLRSDALASIDFLDDAAIAALGARLGIEWEARTPWYGLAWIARPWRARLAGRRPPSRFAILVGKVRP